MRTKLTGLLLASVSVLTLACSSKSKSDATAASVSGAGTASTSAESNAGTTQASVPASEDAALEPATPATNEDDASAPLPTQAAASTDPSTSSSAAVAVSGSVIVDVKRLFMAPGDKDRAIVVRAVGADGKASAVSVSVDTPNVASATLKDGEIAILAVADGHAKVDVSSAAGAHAYFDVYVSLPRAITVHDEYQVGFVDSFELAYSDGGTGCPEDGSFWRPKAIPGFMPLGQYGQSGYDDPSGHGYTLVGRSLPDSDALIPVTNATKFVSKRGFSAWRPTPANGYVSMGDVILPDGSTDYTSFALVREDLTRPGVVEGKIWSCTVVLGDGYLDTNRIGIKSPLDYGELPLTGRWAGASGGSFGETLTPIDPVLHVLVGEVNVARDFDLGAAGVPRTTTLNKPPATEPVRVRSILVPFYTVTDATYDDKWKVANSPWYRLERRDYYAPVLHRANLGATDLQQTLSYTVGIKQAASETFSQKTSVTISAQFGIALGGLSAGGSISVTRELGYERMMSTEAFTEHNLSEMIAVPPETVMTVWQLETRVVLQRFHAGEWETVGDPEGLVSGSDSLVFTQETVE